MEIYLLEVTLSAEAVDYKKASKITSVAKYYISTNNLKNYEIRFDEYVMVTLSDEEVKDLLYTEIV